MMTDSVAAGPTEGMSSENSKTEKEEGVTAWGCAARAGSLGCSRRCCGHTGPEAGRLRTAAPPYCAQGLDAAGSLPSVSRDRM